MSLYSIAIFIHVTGAVMLGFMIDIEWIMVFKLREVQTREEALCLFEFLKIIGRISSIAWLSVLIPGFFMISKAWGWAAWIDTAIAGGLILLISGAFITRNKLNRIGKELENKEKSDSHIKNQMKSNLLISGLQLRSSIALAIIFLMTVNLHY